jgi:hypothetical protein
MSETRDTPPIELVIWLKAHGASELIPDVASSPPSMGGQVRRYVLATTDLSSLDFGKNDYNPREPNEGKIRELQASIIQLSLLTPLTCAYLTPAEREEEDGNSEAVVLIDGRHRFSALKLLEKVPSANSWGDHARVDLKVYYGLSRSELYMLAAYLNRTRKNLRKGEYYKVVADIYQAREIELREKEGHPVTETEVFDSVSSKAVPDKQMDLSIGRLVALAAFDDEESKGWYPLVGLSQKYRFPEFTKYSPITAGNLGVFLASLCKVGPYDDTGETRAIELTNVIKLGRHFRQYVTTDLIDSYAQATGVTVSSKHWVLDAFGKILAHTAVFTAATEEGKPPLAHPNG